jgi:hypothetical protein
MLIKPTNAHTLHFVYFLSSLNKTLKTPTCFGLMDHPQGVCSVPRWLLKYKIIIRRILVIGVPQNIGYWCATPITNILRIIILYFNNQRGTEHTPWGCSIRPKHVGVFNVLLSELKKYAKWIVCAFVGFINILNFSIFWSCYWKYRMFLSDFIILIKILTICVA